MDWTDADATPVEEQPGFVPPYLSSDWREVRHLLHSAGTHITAAARESTVEKVQHLVNVAHTEIERANYVLETIRRKEAGKQ